MVVSPVRSALLCVFCALYIGENQVARGGLITSFQVAFQPTTPAPGWAYLWNNAGPIGNPANYTPLLPNMSGVYTSGGVDVLPGPPPGASVNFSLVGSVPGGHPGLGLQAGSGGIERCAIAEYTLSSSDKISILNGSLMNTNPNNGGSTDGLSLRVFVDDNPTPLLDSGTAPGSQSTTAFGVGLGNLNAGDRIYIAVGSKDEDLFDSFQLSYDIVSVPEPATQVSSCVGLLTFVMLAVRASSLGRRRAPSI